MMISMIGFQDDDKGYKRVFKHDDDADSDDGDEAADIECKRGSRTETMS